MQNGRIEDIAFELQGIANTIEMARMYYVDEAEPSEKLTKASDTIRAATAHLNNIAKEIKTALGY